MYLFIFESIGTSELILIGIIALIFLGPRKLPEMAKKIGKVMAEFRSTTSEFKETWKREVDFEEEAKALDINPLEAETAAPKNTVAVDKPSGDPEVPTIKEIDPASFEHLKTDKTENGAEKPLPEPANDKKNWL